jgi:hypothetical protein
VYRRSLGIHKLERLGDVVQAPFCCFLSQALPLDVPAQRAQSLGRNINVRLGLYGIQDLHDAGMAESPQLAERIAGEG